MNDPVLDELVAIELLPPSCRVLLDPLERLLDVQKSLPVISHSGIASRRTTSLI